MQRTASTFLLALVVTLIVASVALSMGRGLSTRMRAHDSGMARIQARHAALGLLRAVLHDLNVSYADYGQPELVSVLPEGETIGDCSAFLIGRDPVQRAVQFALIPEAALIDVNNASLETLAALPGMDESIAAAIVDWRDEDDDIHQAGGAERGDGFYLSAAVPYAPRNAAFESLAELRLVRGVTDELWFGEDRNANGVLDQGEDRNRDGQLTPGLRDLLCLETREPALNPGGTERVQLMPFNQDVRTLFVERLGEERGQALFTAAQPRQPFTSRLHLIAVLQQEGELSEDEADALWSYLSGPEGRLGLIDAWQASETVLRAAVGSESALTIIDSRPPEKPRSLYWLAEALSNEDIDSIGPLLTSGSYQFRADVLALRNDASGWDRLLVFIDCSTGVSRVLRIQPAATLGWPWPAAQLRSLRRMQEKNPVAVISGGGP